MECSKPLKRNPNSVANCLSPYVPTKAARISALVSWLNLTGPRKNDGEPTSPCAENFPRGTSGVSEDVLLDIGCGDGRVCIAASKISGTCVGRCR